VHTPLAWEKASAIWLIASVVLAAAKTITSAWEVFFSGRVGSGGLLGLLDSEGTLAETGAWAC